MPVVEWIAVLLSAVAACSFSAALSHTARRPWALVLIGAMTPAAAFVVGFIAPVGF